MKLALPQTAVVPVASTNNPKIGILPLLRPPIPPPNLAYPLSRTPPPLSNPLFCGQNAFFKVTLPSKGPDILGNVHIPLCVTCPVSRVTCHVSHVTCYVSHVTYHMSHLGCDMSHFF